MQDRSLEKSSVRKRTTAPTAQPSGFPFQSSYPTPVIATESIYDYAPMTVRGLTDISDALYEPWQVDGPAGLPYCQQRQMSFREPEHAVNSRTGEKYRTGGHQNHVHNSGACIVPVAMSI